MTEQKEKKVEDIKKEADQKNCPVQRSLYFIDEFLAGPMCGKCFPCSFGSYEARVRLRRLARGAYTADDITAIKRIASNMAEASMCKKGKDTARYILDHVDSEEFTAHAAGLCAQKECSDFISYVIIPEKCTMCGVCLDACKDNAILGEKKTKFAAGYMPFEIVQKRCTKCGECLRVCPEEAIIIVDAKVKEPAGV